MAVVIDTGLDPMTKARTIPRDQWRRLAVERKYACLRETPNDCRNLLLFIADGAESEWLGYGSREEYIRKGLDLDPEAVDLAVRFLSVMNIGVPLAFEAAIAGGRKLAAHGANQHSGGPDNIRSTPPAPDYGTSRGYLLARLDRDRPELAELVRAGELSANAAAIKAGFRKVPSGIDRLRAAWRKATQDERDEFLTEVGWDGTS